MMAWHASPATGVFSVMMVTALPPIIGYDKAAAISWSAGPEAVPRASEFR
jgi:fumarate hydratase class II